MVGAKPCELRPAWQAQNRSVVVASHDHQREYDIFWVCRLVGLDFDDAGVTIRECDRRTCVAVQFVVVPGTVRAEGTIVGITESLENPFRETVGLWWDVGGVIRAAAVVPDWNVDGVAAVQLG